MARLDEIFNLQMGKTPSRNNLEYWVDGKNCWVSIADLGTYQKFTSDTKEKITDIAVCESGIKCVPENTVIMSFKLSLGKTAITKEPVYTNEAIMAFIPTGKFEVLPDYFYYVFSGRDWSKDTNRAVMGSTLNKATLSEISVDVPSLEEQQKIAAVLDKVSDLIAKRRQQLEKLDLLVKARFVEMFGNLKNNRNTTTTIEAISEMVTVGIANSATHAYDDKGVVLLRNQNIRENYLDDSDLIYITPDFANKYKSKALKKDDILVTRTGYPGIACLVPNRYAGCQTFTTLIVRLKESIEILPLFVCCYINSDYGKTFVEEMKVGVAQQNFGAKALGKMPIFVPPIEDQIRFSAFVEQIEKTKTSVKECLTKLETLKKSLMQEYFG